jgi:hypothetical protein
MFYSILSVSIDVSIDVSIECPSSVHRVSTTRQVTAKDNAAHTFTMILFVAKHVGRICVSKRRVQALLFETYTSLTKATAKGSTCNLASSKKPMLQTLIQATSKLAAPLPAFLEVPSFCFVKAFAPPHHVANALHDELCGQAHRRATETGNILAPCLLLSLLP